MAIDHLFHTPESLALIATPAPTPTWRPIAHSKVRRLLLRALAADGWGEPIAETLETTHENADCFGTLRFEDTANTRTTVGFRNSHRQRFGVAIVGGKEVLICSNEELWGEYRVSRKHTAHLHVELPGIIRSIVAKLPAQVLRSTERDAHLADRIISVADAKSLIVCFAEDGILNGSKILETVAEFRNPSFDYRFQQRSALGLNAAVTHVLKAVKNPIDRQTRLLQLSTTLDKMVDFR